MAEQLYDYKGSNIYPKTELDASVAAIDASVKKIDSSIASMTSKISALDTSMKAVKDIKISNDLWDNSPSESSSNIGIIYYARNTRVDSYEHVYQRGPYIIAKNDDDTYTQRHLLGELVTVVTNLDDSSVQYHCNFPGAMVFDASKEKLYVTTEWGQYTTFDSSVTGGTTDYTQLSNIPAINDVSLIGNKTSAELGIVGKDYDASINAINSSISRMDASIQELYTILGTINSSLSSI